MPNHPQPCRSRIRDVGHELAPSVGLCVALQDRDRHRSTRPSNHPPEHRHFLSRLIEVRDHLHPPATGAAYSFTNLRQLGLLRGERRNRPTVQGTMVQGSRRRKPQRPSFDSGRGKARHFDTILGRSRLAVGTALPHYVDAQRRMGHLAANIKVIFAGGKSPQVLFEGLPVPRQPFR